MVKSSTSGAEGDVNAWLRKATEDEEAARVLLREGPPAPACFHTQQMAEKLLKALVIQHTHELPKVHDLVSLAGMANTDLTAVKVDIQRLNRYYVEPRYPGDFPEFSRPECAEALQAALRVKDVVLRELGEA